ncbi:MAG: hypothetical protein J1F17_02955, partial [Oscillospiraceae bacterium]|nr:hypothetical protein [Oscillospiraceae bacterium]
GSTLKKSDTSAIAENNFYLYYHYSSVKTITYPETDRLYSIRYNSGASEKCSGITFSFSGFNEKLGDLTYVKSSTTVTATATPTNASYTIKEFVYGSRIANFKQNGNTATFNVVDNDATLGAKFTDIMKLQCIQTSYIYYTIEGTEYIDVRSIDQVIGGEDKIFGSGKTITVKIKVSEAGIEAGFCIGSVTRSGADDFELRYTDSSQTEATLTFTIGLANIKIDPNIKSNKIGVTVFAEDEEGNPVIAFDGESEKHFAGYIGGDVVLTAPTIPGYRFDGWYMDDEIGGLLSKKLTYRVPGEYFNESFNVYARYEKISVDQNFGILSYSHSTYHLTSQKGTVEDTPAPVVETKKGYTSGAYETQQTGWVTRNGKNDYTVIYADYDSYVLKDFSATLKASTLPNSSAYTFLGWLQDGTVDVSKLSQNLKYGFDDIADDDAEPFTTYNLIATWDDQIYDIDLDYDYKRYNGDVVMEPDFDLKNDGVTAPTIKRTVTGVSRSSFLANIERFATDYAPIVNDTRYDYTFVYDRYVIQSNPNGATHGKIKYYAVADYGKTSVQKYSIKIGTGSPERYDIKYIRPDKTTVMKTDYGYYNWLARLTSEHEADGDTYFLWYVFTDTDHTDYDILLCTNSKNSFDIRLTAANFDKRIYLFVGKGTDKFDGKELSSLAFEYNVACNGNYVTYTNIDYTTYFNFRIDVNCPDGFKLKKMGVIYYFAEDNILPDEHDEYYVQPDGFNKNYESGKYLVDNDDLEIFARNATQDGKWMLSGNNADDPYACGVDLTAFRNADNQVIYIVPVNNQLSGGYLWNIVFVGYVIYEDSEGNEYTVFSERFVGSVPHEYYNGGNMNS